MDSFFRNDGLTSLDIDAVSPDKTASTITNEIPSPTGVSQELFSSSEKEHDGILRIKIDSQSAKSEFCVPLSQLIQREEEMRAACEKARVPKSQWSSSLLYEKWKSFDSQNQKMSFRGKSKQFFVEINPEEAMKDYSTLFEWKPWLTLSIRNFYQSGKIRVPEECVGSDLLIALEYLRIITISPNIFNIDTYAPYERIKIWSNYFTKRRHIMDWVVKDFKTQGNSIRTYTTSASSYLKDEQNLTVKGQPTDILGLDGKMLPRLIHDLFIENKSPSPRTKDVPRRIRHDFRDQLLRFLPSGTKISFELHRVSLGNQDAREIRPVLRIEGPDTKLQNKPKKIVSKPLSVINMPLDSKSVTSALSHSIIDDGSLNTFFRNHEDDKSKKKERAPLKSAIKDPSRLRIKSRNQKTTSSLKAKDRKAPKESQPSSTTRTTCSRPKRESSSRSRKSEEEDTNTYTSENDTTRSSYIAPTRKSKSVCDSFEQFLFTVCDKGVAFCDHVVPSGPLPGRSESPIRLITVAEDQTQFSILTLEENQQQELTKSNTTNSPFEFCPHAVQNHELVAAIPKDLIDVEGAIATATSVGNSIYNQVDQFVTQTMDPTSSIDEPKIKPASLGKSRTLQTNNRRGGKENMGI